MLVVDDDFDQTYILKHGLAKYGFEVDAYNDANTVLKQFKPSYYNIVLIDFKMPNMNGFESYRKLKVLDPKINVCFLSADSLHYKEHINRLQEFDENHFVHKPILIAELAKRLDEIITVSNTDCHN